MNEWHRQSNSKTETHNLRGNDWHVFCGTEAYRFGGFYARLGLERGDGLFAGRVLGLAPQSKEKTKTKNQCMMASGGNADDIRCVKLVDAK